MSSRFNTGDHVYIISNGVRIDELIVINVSGDFYTLSYTQTGGGTRLAAHRLYASREEAQAVLDEKMKRNTDYRRPY